MRSVNILNIRGMERLLHADDGVLVAVGVVKIRVSVWAMVFPNESVMMIVSSSSNVAIDSGFSPSVRVPHSISVTVYVFVEGGSSFVIVLVQVASVVLVT